MKQTIKGIRVNMGLSSEDFAKKLDTTTNILTNYELGRTIPDVIFVDKLLKLTGLKYEDIIFLPKNCNLIAKEN